MFAFEKYRLTTTYLKNERKESRQAAKSPRNRTFRSFFASSLLCVRVFEIASDQVGTIRLRVLMLGVVSLMSLLNVVGQDRGTIKGRVLDHATQKPVSGVNVIVRGGKTGTMTDTAGYFRLELPDRQKHIIAFSHIAYQKETRLVSFDTTREVVLRITLFPDTLRLQEYVITGFRRIVISEAAKRRALWTIGGDEFEKLGWDDMEKALKYMLPFQQNFTLYVNGEFQESHVLRELDPYTVRRVMVWEMLGPGHNKTIDIFPIGMPLHTGTHVISIETKQ